MYLLVRFTMLSDSTHVMLLMMVGSSTEITQLFVCRENKKNKIPKPLNKKNKQTLQLAKDKRRNNDPQTSYRKLTTEQHEPHEKPGMNSGASEG